MRLFTFAVGLVTCRAGQRQALALLIKEIPMSSQPIVFHAYSQTIAADTWPVAAVMALFDMPFADLISEISGLGAGYG